MEIHDPRRDALLAWWMFGEGRGTTVKDTVSGCHDPIHYVFNQARFKPASAPLWRTGIRGHALLFDGYSTWVTRPAAQMPQPEQELTLEAWVAPASFEHGDEGKLSAIVNQHDRDRREGYVLGVFRHGTWSFQIGVAGQWHELWSEDHRLPRTAWSHVVATFDGGRGCMALYLNGERVAERGAPANRAIVPSSEPLLLGRNNTGALLNGVFTLNMFHGLLGEVKVYRRALSAAAVRDSYHAYRYGVPGHVLPAPDLTPQHDRFAGDRHRPQYHFMPPEHWMNEPHAPLYFKGRYHLFYQHNPHGPYWHNIHWGHAVSCDLVHWNDLPYALIPEHDTVDPDGCWSGSVVVDEAGVPTIFYAAGDNRRSPNQAVGLARSTVVTDGDLDLITWVKHPQPVVEQQPGIGQFGEFRDPFVWGEEDTWYLLVTSGIPGRGGTALLYTSADLVAWTYRNPLYVGDLQAHPKTGEVWELPVFLPIGRDSHGALKHILVINPWFSTSNLYQSKYIFYWLGTWDRATYRFIPDNDEPQVFDLGEHFIGPSALIDTQGRIILFTVVRSGLSPQHDHDLGWANNAGLPVVLSLREDGCVGVAPIPELQVLRQEHLLSLQDQSLVDANCQLQDVGGAMLEIVVELERGAAARYGLCLRRTPDGVEETIVCYDAAAGTLRIDRRRSSMDPAMERDVVGGTVDLRGENLCLHIYLDHSMVDVFVNELKSLITRVYPVREDALGLQLWGDGTATVRSLDVWRLGTA